MSFYKEVPGLETTLESALKFDTTPTAGSTNPVTSDGVAKSNADILDDGDGSGEEEEVSGSAYYYSHEVGKFYFEQGTLWKCFNKTHDGDTYITYNSKMNGVVAIANDIVDRIADLNTGMGEVVAAALNDLYARVRANEEAVSETNLGDRTADRLDVQELLVGGEELNNVTRTVPNT